MAGIRGRSKLGTDRLVKEIRKIGNRQLGTDEGQVTKAVMKQAEDLHMASRRKREDKLLGGKSIREHLGSEWVSSNPGVARTVDEIEAAKAKGRKR